MSAPQGDRGVTKHPASLSGCSNPHSEQSIPLAGGRFIRGTIQRCVVKYTPQLEAAFHRWKRPVWVSWCMDETYIRVKGQRITTVRHRD